jgi:two-component system LytT family response regulator
MTIKAMIVDDEPFARKDLRHMLTQHPDIEVKWEAAKMDEAQSLLTAHCPDVVFLDIELRGGLGFELVTHLDRQKTGVIFVTGHEAYAEQAFEYGALDCLSKPVAAGNLARSLEKLKHALAARDG